MIVKIPEKYDLCIMCSWGNFSRDNQHGVSGHVYEMIEYFYILKNHLNCCLYFPQFNKDIINISLNKYSFTDIEKNEILDNSFFGNNKHIRIFQARNILSVDGFSFNLLDSVTFIKNENLLCFYTNKDLTSIKDKKVYVLTDFRLLNKNEVENNKNRILIDYKKKILFNKLIKHKVSENRTLIYCTKSCRKLTKNILEKLDKNEKYIFISDYKEKLSLELEKYLFKNYDILEPPIYNIYSKFNKYIYTTISRKWDSSPRLLAESFYFGKEIEFLIDYEIKEDLGLFYRWSDIKNDFKSIVLNEDDSIINIIKKVINV